MIRPYTSEESQGVNLLSREGNSQTGHRMPRFQYHMGCYQGTIDSVSFSHADPSSLCRECHLKPFQRQIGCEGKALGIWDQRSIHESLPQSSYGRWSFGCPFLWCHLLHPEMSSGKNLGNNLFISCPIRFWTSSIFCSYSPSPLFLKEREFLLGVKVKEETVGNKIRLAVTLVAFI